MCVSAFIFFTASDMPLCEYVVFFIHLPVCEHLDCFQILEIINKAAVNVPDRRLCIWTIFKSHRLFFNMCAAGRTGQQSAASLLQFLLNCYRLLVPSVFASSSYDLTYCSFAVSWYFFKWIRWQCRNQKLMPYRIVGNIATRAWGVLPLPRMPWWYVNAGSFLWPAPGPLRL